MVQNILFISAEWGGRAFEVEIFGGALDPKPLIVPTHRPNLRPAGLDEPVHFVGFVQDKIKGIEAVDSLLLCGLAGAGEHRFRRSWFAMPSSRERKS